MLSYLRGMLALLFLALNTLFWSPSFLVVAIVKLIAPVPGVRRKCGRTLDRISVTWMGMNLWYIRKTMNVEWNIRIPGGLSKDKTYLVMANHVSWLDIIALEQKLLYAIPFPRFFVKQALLFVPILGFAWWALDYPFMKRYSQEYLRKHPECKGRDLEITRRKCVKFARIPVAVMTFPEGTRFTDAKRVAKRSPYKRLLAPKAGGTALVISALGKNLHGILSATIVYPDGSSFLAFLCGKVSRISVIVEEVPFAEDLIGDYMSDPKYQKRIRAWMNKLWDRKEAIIEKELARYNKTKTKKSKGTQDTQ